MTKFKRQEAPEITDAIQHLDRIAQNAAEDKPYDHFGKYVAAELRQLPRRQAILLQQETQNATTNYKLSCLENVQSPYPHYTDQSNVDVVSPSSSFTSTPSVNDDYDVLNQSIINTFGTNKY